jgi:ComF family protein
VFNYDGAIKELIHLFKYKNKKCLYKPLAQTMVEFIKDYNLPIDNIDIVTPIPLYHTRLWEREYNQAELLARQISSSFGLNLSVGNLIRLRNTKPQSALNTKKRLNNLKGAFGVKSPEQFKEKTILIIDDLLTTGTTISEAALTLKQGGAKDIFVLTLAIAR